MAMRDENEQDNPMHHPDEQPSGSEHGPHFGRLLIVLVGAVMLLGLITWASVAYVT